MRRNCDVGDSPVGVEKTLGRPVGPSTRPAVDIFGGLALGAAIRVAVDLGEEQTALPLEVFRVEHASGESQITAGCGTGLSASTSSLDDGHTYSCQ